jgi:ABC-type glutathione transport system ATPase component
MLEVRGVSKIYGSGKGTVAALHDVNLDVPKGSCVGLVGGSGSGKTTLTRCIMAAEPVSQGKIIFEGRDIQDLSKTEIFDMRRQMQMVFQDPYASLNPRQTVGEIVSEPLVVHQARLRLTRPQRMERVEAILQKVGLGAQFLHRYPHEFSGGQRQRIGIARALVLEPQFLVMDEPTSALDVSVQATILNLLKSLRRDLGLTILFISHDLGVVRYLCDDVVIIHNGTIVERGPTEQVFDSPQSDYAKALIAAVPDVAASLRGRGRRSVPM